MAESDYDFEFCGSIDVVLFFFVNMDIINQFSFVMKYSKSNSFNKDKDHHSRRSSDVKKEFSRNELFFILLITRHLKM